VKGEQVVHALGVCGEFGSRSLRSRRNKIKVGHGTMPNKLLKAIAEAVLAAIFKRLAPNDLRNQLSRHRQLRARF
jgi:hypothetical protein